MMFVRSKFRIVKRFFLPLLSVVLLQTSCATNKDTGAVHPPFLQGKRFLVSQAFNNDQTHTGLLNRYAVDLVMPSGEPVCAVAAGKVVAIKKHGKGSHYVRIQHTTGFISDYQHLLTGSIQVKTGDKVSLGKCFAKVGATGSTAGPHLHFAMLLNVAGVYVSKPFKFISPNSTSYTPRYLEWVYN